MPSVALAKEGVGARLFCTIYGGPMSTSYMRQLLPRLAKRAGICYLLRQA